MMRSGAAYANDQLGSSWNTPVLVRGQSGRIAMASRSKRSISNMLDGAHVHGNQGLTTSGDFAEMLSSIGAGSESARIAAVGDDYLENLLTDNEIEQIRSEDENLLNRILSAYVFEDAANARSFLEDHPSVTEILLDAAPFLKESFGESAILQLQIPPDEDIPVTAYAVALWDGSLEDARAALNKFDGRWWTANSQKGSGRIVFDYQLV